MENCLYKVGKKYKIITFGCQMNVHESEKLAGILIECGYNECDSIEDADIIVFNTCCIRDNAEKRAEGNIGALKKLKKSKPSVIIAVCGCMVQQEGRAEELRKKFPFVDIILGTSNFGALKTAIKSVENSHDAFIETYLDSSKIGDSPIYRTSGVNAWVNIMYGCNNFCSYCIVPYVRGRERSRDKSEILKEIEQLLSEGYKEITLLGQNVNSYSSVDNKGFAGLLKDISGLGDGFRLRFMTSHPKDLSEEMIEVMNESKVVCKNIHLPLQSGSDKVLRDMNRKYDSKRYLHLIDLLRKYMPDIGISTDIMVGFPTETEDDFNQTLELVKRARFSGAFTFVYSPRRFTPAAKLPQIDDEIKKRRIIELVGLQNKITAENNKNFIGKTVEVLCEGHSNYEGMVCGRTDCGRMVNFKGNDESIGNFYQVEIGKVKTGSMFGEVKNG